MRVKFSADYHYTPSLERRLTYAYKAGEEYTVKREAGEAAVAAGVAKEVKGHTRAKDDDETKGAVGSASAAETPEDMKKILAAEQADR